MTLVIKFARHAVKKCVTVFFSISNCVFYSDLNNEREKIDNRVTESYCLIDQN